MIEIKYKDKCCGCNACVLACPIECISFLEDNEGFLYPKVNTETCIDCGRCENVCPVIHQDEAREPLETYAAVNNNEQIRVKSSSGGIFTLLAEKVLAEGGVVFGAIFNKEWEVIHTIAHNSEELAPMRGSKYVQSKIGESYQNAKNHLEKGKKVLFSGTSCQIAGLRRYLQKEYHHLICIDVICHGVPSPAVFKAYFTEEANRLGTDLSSLQHISFRDKRKGWRNFSLSRTYAIKNDVYEISKTISTDLYIQGFLRDLYLRPSCYTCPAKAFKSGSDISLADLWAAENIVPELDDNKGVSIVFINSNSGREYFNYISKEVRHKEISLSEAVQRNPYVYSSVIEPKERKQFFDLFRTKSVYSIMKKLIKIPFIIKFGTALNKIGLLNIIRRRLK